MSSVRNGQGDVDIDLGTLFSSLTRRWLRILAFSLLAAAAAFLLASFATPLYNAETRLLIEVRESEFTRPANNGESDRPLLDEEGIVSQVEVISSSDILKQVADKLELAKLPEFDATGATSGLGRLMVVLGLKGDPGDIPAEERVLAAMREKLSVYRVEKSRVIVIEFSSRDPRLAAAIPNAIADAYIAVQRDVKQLSNTDATAWLEPEIANLTKRVRDAEAKVAAFRSQSDLLVGQDNRVLSTQQLSELSSELSRVRAARSAAEATAQGVRAALKSGASFDALPEIQSSGAMQRLRERQIQLKADIADLSTTLLDGHPRIRALRSQLADLDRQIRAEGENVLNGLVTEAQTAQAREAKLIGDLNALKAQSARAGEEEVDLRALEREANSQRELLESYMTRYREASSRRDGNYLPADARIFSRADAPSEPYFPKVIPIVGAAFAGSLLLMIVATLLRELFSGRAMRLARGGDFEAIEDVSMPPYDNRSAANRSGDWYALHGAAGESDESTVDMAAEKLINGGVARAIFVSPDSDEAAAAAVLVARAVADAGLRTLLLDLSGSGAASRPMLEGTNLPGITNLLSSEAQFSDVIHPDHYSDCHVIPVGTADPVRAMRAVERLPIILQSLNMAYDVVVIECGATEAGAVARLLSEDAAIFLSALDLDDPTVAAVAASLRERFGVEPTLVTPGDGMAARADRERSAA